MDPIRTSDPYVGQEIAKLPAQKATTPGSYPPVSVMPSFQELIDSQESRNPFKMTASSKTNQVHLSQPPSFKVIDNPGPGKLPGKLITEKGPKPSTLTIKRIPNNTGNKLPHFTSLDNAGPGVENLPNSRSLSQKAQNPRDLAVGEESEIQKKPVRKKSKIPEVDYVPNEGISNEQLELLYELVKKGSAAQLKEISVNMVETWNKERAYHLKSKKEKKN